MFERCADSRFIVKNYEYLEELMLLKQADYSACKDDLSPAPTVVKMRAILENMKAEGVPFTLKELSVRAHISRAIFAPSISWP